MRNKQKIGVILMTYGSATTADHVRDFLEHIYPSKISDQLVEDFENRYRLIEKSPLIEITERQAMLLQKKLRNEYIVRAGMRHSAPFILDAVQECVNSGVTELRGVILSPQFSSFSMTGYKKDFTHAAEKFGVPDAQVSGSWPDEPHFIDLLVKRTKAALSRLGEKTPVVFTTHSLPQRVVEEDPSYLEQLQKTIDAVRKKLPVSVEWYQGYQSAGHTSEEWLKPDLTDVLADLKKQGHSSVLIVPIQFLSDHLEILYDLDIAARAQCEGIGIDYHRIELPNIDPLFIEALAAVVLLPRHSYNASTNL